MRRTVVAALVTLTAALTAPAPVGAQSPDDPRPPGWRAAMDKSLDLTLAKRYEEVIALWEKWIGSHPEFGDGHAMLGGAHESLARELQLRGGTRNRERAEKHFAIALTHLRRALDLGPSRDIAIRSIVDIYRPGGLNKPAEREAFVREVTTRFPTEPRGHVELAEVLAGSGRLHELDAALATARREVPADATSRMALAGPLWAVAEESAPVAFDRLSLEAVTLVDAVLKKERHWEDALSLKARVLRGQAQRTVDLDRRKALIADAERVEQQERSARQRRRR